MLSREKILECLLELSARPSSRSRGGLIERVLVTALAVAEGDAAAVLHGSSRRSERWVLRRGLDRPERAEAERSGSEFSRLLQRTGVPLAIHDANSDGRLGLEDRCPGVEAGPALFIPLRQRDQAPAHLAVFRHRGAARFSADETSYLTLLGAWTSMALENVRLSESVEKLAITDDLTQVYNYRFLKSALRREIKRAGRFRQDLSIVMMDVDNLKAYNDRHGHLRGSFLLRELASLFAAQVRSFDLVAKYGGDEFTIILPQTGREGAVVVAERMRASVEAHAFPLAPRGHITVSLGVATFPADAGDPTNLLQAADRALYLAKQRGKNRVETLWTRAA
jgi:diguanylate cyclase (GGDEF)-like protein